MSILVTGGTGTVGSQVVQELSKRGVPSQVLTRDPAKAGSLPSGATAVQGNLLEVGSVRQVFKGIQSVFLLNPVGLTETAEALMALTQMRLDGVKKVVYLSVHHADGAAHLPHFGSKVGVEEAIKRSGLAYTILRPNNFYQNDYWFKDVILQFGVYPQPIGSTGLSRVDVRDIAEAAAVALTSSSGEGQTYDLVGPEVVTGPSTAQVWSDVLGRTITYGGDDLEAWEKVQLQYLPDFMVFDFKEMYRHFQRNGLKASAEAIARQTALLGHAPRDFRTFAAETARAWTAAPATGA
jgi:uncharacterized protein YbjT (DUF2867 family)